MLKLKILKINDEFMYILHLNYVKKYIFIIKIK